MIEVVTNGKKTKPPRLIIYGIEGIGKSTLASCAPKPVFLPTEEGLNQIDCQSFPKVERLAELNSYLDALELEEHDFQTVVIDSIDWLERLICREIADQFGARSIEKVDGGYGRGYSYAADTWREILDKLDTLRNTRKLGVILIGHAKSETITDPEAQDVTRYSLRLNKNTAALLCEWADAVLFATRLAGAARGIDGGERVLRTQAAASCVAKNRYGFNEIIPLSWQALQDGIVNHNQDKKKEN